MLAIQTQYFGPTNTRGSRIKASCDVGSVTISYPHELSTENAHRLAAQTLGDKRGWTGQFETGYLKSGVYVHVFIG